MSYKIKKDGEWVTVANGSRMFVGSTAAINAAIARGELKYPDLYADTSDWAEEVTSGTGTVNASYLSGEVVWTVKDGVALVTFNGVSVSNSPADGTKIVTGLPKPLALVRTWLPLSGSANSTFKQVNFSTDGSVATAGGGNMSDGRVYTSITYPVA